MQIQTTCTLATFLLLAACATSHTPVNSSPFHFPEAAPMPAPPATSTNVAAATVDSTDVPLVERLTHELALAEPLADELAHVEPLAHEFADVDASQGQPGGRPPKWRNGQALLSGYFGAAVYDLSRDTNVPGTTVEADDVDLPSIGGGGQVKLGGDAIDFGIEGMIGFNWRAGSTAVAVGGGGVAVAVDVDLFVMDLYGGPFANIDLGNAARVFAGAGPLMQWAAYEDSFDDDGSGFGFGYYARAGIELQLGRGTLMGFALRWSDTEIDLGGRLGDLQADGLLWMVTYSHYY